ncbi:MAG TPA: ABC transporter ATP-binding protein [Actinobacteria bacterium]|nr:ABC transporter ATP-binding protein [Actinomycetes bacterium]HEX21219.1 ABC transporter ATP-binding protein [Actinomycetota bacterium]
MELENHLTKLKDNDIKNEGAGTVEISVKDLVKSFGRRTVLHKISFDLNKGDFLSIFGPNGAGKTTTLKILSTLIAPTSGEITVSGIKLTDDPTPIRQKIGFISHNPLLYHDLNALENLQFYGALYQVPDLNKRIDELLERVELSHRRYDLIRGYSKGMMQRLSIARALLHKPSILFLDEPHSGLDPHAVDILDGLLDDIRPEHTFIMITHNLGKGLSLCSAAMILDGGNIVFYKDKAALNVDEFEQTYRFIVKGENE